MLHDITGVPKGNRRWCGPSAISLISGIRYDAATKLLREVSGRRAITGTSTGMVLRAFYELGYHATRLVLRTEPRLTLARWLRERDGLDRTAPILIEVTHHWMVVQGRKGGDSATGKPVWLSDLPRRRITVQAAYRLSKRP